MAGDHRLANGRRCTCAVAGGKSDKASQQDDCERTFKVSFHFEKVLGFNLNGIFLKLFKFQVAQFENGCELVDFVIGSGSLC